MTPHERVTISIEQEKIESVAHCIVHTTCSVGFWPIYAIYEAFVLVVDWSQSAWRARKPQNFDIIRKNCQLKKHFLIIYSAGRRVSHVQSSDEESLTRLPSVAFLTYVHNLWFVDPIRLLLLLLLWLWLLLLVVEKPKVQVSMGPNTSPPPPNPSLWLRVLPGFGILCFVLFDCFRFFFGAPPGATGWGRAVY